jgi:hypothetical protein
VTPVNNDSVSLRQHVEALIEERDKRYTERAESADKAVQAALAAAEKAVNAALTAAKEAAEANAIALKEYKQGANEWRATVTDITARMPTRPEMESAIKVLEDKINDLRESRSASVGKGMGLNAGWGYLIGAVGLIGAIVALVVKFG